MQRTTITLDDDLMDRLDGFIRCCAAPSRTSATLRTT